MDDGARVQFEYHDNDVRLRLFFTDQVNDGHDSIGDHIGCVAVIVGAHQQDDYLRGRCEKQTNKRGYIGNKGHQRGRKAKTIAQKLKGKTITRLKACGRCFDPSSHIDSDKSHPTTQHALDI